MLAFSLIYKCVKHTASIFRPKFKSDYEKTIFSPRKRRYQKTSKSHDHCNSLGKVSLETFPSLFYFEEQSSTFFAAEALIVSS